MLAPELLEPLLYRDDEQIERVLTSQIATSGFESTLAQISQFAILAYAPDERSRATLLALEGLTFLAEQMASETRSRQLIDLARMSADARRPWSEAPITSAPATKDGDADENALMRAVVERDRLAAERWIARTSASPGFHDQFFSCAARIADDEHAPVRIAACVWRLAEQVPPPYRFAVLRIAAVEWTAGHRWLKSEMASHETATADADSVIADYATSDEPLLAFLTIEALDAAQFAREVASRSPLTSLASRATISSGREHVFAAISKLEHSPLDDYGTAVRALAIAQRRSGSWSDEALGRLCAAALSAPRVA